MISTAITPLPEETALLAAGWLAHRADASLLGAIACALAAVLVGDVVTFALGRGLFTRVVDSKRLGRLFPPERRAWAEAKVERHGWRAILLARCLVGLRGFLYFAIGGSRYPFRRFFALDVLFGFVEVGVIVAAGWLVGTSRHARARIEAIDIVAIAIIVASAVVPWLIRRVFGRHHARGGASA